MEKTNIDIKNNIDMIRIELEKAGLEFGKDFNEETLKELVDGKGEEYDDIQQQ